MSEGKHTLGPWRVEEGTTLIWGACNPDDSSNYGMGYPIAECRVTPSAAWAKGPDGWDEGEANALLISAAPDLLRELRGSRCPRPCNNRPDGFEVGQCVDAGECGCSHGAAISKAKGINPDE